MFALVCQQGAACHTFAGLYRFLSRDSWVTQSDFVLYFDCLSGSQSRNTTSVTTSADWKRSHGVNLISDVSGDATAHTTAQTEEVLHVKQTTTGAT